MTSHPDLFAALAAPFDHQEVKVRTQAGRQLHYITARTVMNRLDSVLGPENWWDEYTPHENSVLCRLTVRLPDGSTLTKSDAGGYAGMSDSGDDDKSGYSDAFKRTAVKFGVGRYLYRDGVAHFTATQAIATDNGKPSPVSTPEPTPPARSLGWVHGDPEPAAPSRNPHPHRNPHKSTPAPRSGKALFGWCKDQEQRHQVGLLKYLNQWARLQDFPGRMIDWDADQVALAYAEAVHKLQALPRAEPAGVAS